MITTEEIKSFSEMWLERELHESELEFIQSSESSSAEKLFFESARGTGMTYTFIQLFIYIWLSPTLLNTILVLKKVWNSLPKNYFQSLDINIINMRGEIL